MVEIQSKEAIDQISEDLKVQPALKIPRKLAEQIQLTYNINPERQIKVIADVESDGTSKTLHTTDSTKDTYIVGATISVSKDAVHDGIFTSLNATPKFQSATNLMSLRYEPLTAGEHMLHINFPLPILLERGTTIRILNNTATASIDAGVTIFYYEVDPQ